MSTNSRGRQEANSDRGGTAMLVVFALTSFVVILNAAALPIPLPSIMADLGGTLDEITWVLAAFVLSFAVLLLPCARLGDTHGRRRLFVVGSVLFTVASLGCALAPSLSFLIGAQVLLGAAAAMVEPAIYGAITTVIPEESRTLAFKVQTIGLFAGGALGPILSGALVTAWSWRALFWVNVPVGAAVALGAWRLMPDSRARRPAHRDMPGFLSLAGALFLLVFALIEGTRFGWTTAPIIASLATAVVLLVVFLQVERRAQEPLVDLRLFTDRRFAVGNVVRAGTEFASLGIFFALSHFIQVQLGHSALAAGGLLMVVIVGTLMTAPLAERFTGRIDVRWLVVPGFVLVAAGTFWVAHVSPTTSWLFFLAPLAVFGFGIGGLESPAEKTTHSDIPVAYADAAWRVAYVTYLLGIALGVAVVSAVWQTQLADIAPSHAGLPGAVGDPARFAEAVNTALLSCVGVALLCGIAALFLRSNQALTRPVPGRR